MSQPQLISGEDDDFPQQPKRQITETDAHAACCNLRLKSTWTVLIATKSEHSKSSVDDSLFPFPPQECCIRASWPEAGDQIQSVDFLATVLDSLIQDRVPVERSFCSDRRWSSPALNCTSASSCSLRPTTNKSQTTIIISYLHALLGFELTN